MSDRNYAPSQLGAQAANTSMSRIENNVEDLKRFVTRVRTTEDRIMRHARALGYYVDTPGAPGSISPVGATLADAIQDLDMALERVACALNVFD